MNVLRRPNWVERGLKGGKRGPKSEEESRRRPNRVEGGRRWQKGLNGAKGGGRGLKEAEQV